MPTKKKTSDNETLQRRNRELSILNAIASALNREVDLTRSLNAALAQVQKLLDLETSWLWLMHEETGEPYLAAAENLPPALADNPKRLTTGTCYCLTTYQAGDLDGAANIGVIACSRLQGLVKGTSGLRYHASIPLYAHDKNLGILNVASSDWRELSDDDLRLLYTVGDLMSMAIERARLFAKSAEYGAAEERNRLAREIHDTIAQGLSAIAIQLETAEELLQQNHGSASAREKIDQALSLTRANLEEARRSVLDLRAAPLEGKTLDQALTALARDWSSKSNVPVKQNLPNATHPLPIRIESGLYRVAQEGLENIQRHARAKRVKLELETLPNQVRLVIQDDGHGFNPSRVPKGRYGLIGINERVKLIGGTLRLESSANTGTRLEVIVPLDAKL